MGTASKRARLQLQAVVTSLIVAGASLTSAFAASTTAPYIMSVTPTSGSPGTVITVTGSGLSNITTAWIGAAHDATVTNVSNTTVEVTIPKDATTGSLGISDGTNWSFGPQWITITASTTTSSGTSSSSSSGSSSSGSSSSGSSSSSSSSSGNLSVKVSGNHLVDGSGNTLQLRGVNVSGLEFVPVQGWDPSDPWGSQTGDASPNWTAIKSWHANTVRIPLNEASWLGYTCTDSTGATRNPDAGGNYKATVASAVSGATAAGLYVILDLHWTAPGNFCPLAQNQMADTDHSIAFWSSLATQFKSYPNVLFELFNEPFVGYGSASAADWAVIMKGGAQTNYVTGGTPYQVNYNWTVAGMQQMLSAVRATGASNVVLVGSATWDQDLSAWVANKPTDPLNQIAAAWHPYPNSNTVGDPQAALPKFGSIAYTWAQSVLDAGYPIVATETGDHDATGTVGAPLLANLLPWADARSVSYLGWAWDVWGDADDVLIKDAAGDPTDGYGVYFKQHLTDLAGK
jgi:endoglucanase